MGHTHMDMVPVQLSLALLLILFSTPPLSPTLLLNVKPKPKQTQLISTMDTLDMLDLAMLDTVCHMPMELTIMELTHMLVHMELVYMELVYMELVYMEPIMD